MQHQYAQAATDIAAARLMVYNAARLKMAGQPFMAEAAMAKLFASQVSCLQILIYMITWGQAVREPGRCRYKIHACMRIYSMRVYSINTRICMHAHYFSSE